MKTNYAFKPKLEKQDNFQESFQRASPQPNASINFSQQHSPQFISKFSSAKSKPVLDLQKQMESIIKKEEKQQKILHLNYKHKSIAGKLLNILEDNLKAQLRQKQSLLDLQRNLEQNIEELLISAQDKFQSLSIQLQSYYQKIVESLKLVHQNKTQQIQKQQKQIDLNLQKIHLAAQNLTIKIDAKDLETFKIKSNQILTNAEQASFLKISQQFSKDFCIIDSALQFNAELIINDESQNKNDFQLLARNKSEPNFKFQNIQNSFHEDAQQEHQCSTKQPSTNFYEEETQEQQSDLDFNDQIENLEKEIKQLKNKCQTQQLSPTNNYSFEREEEDNTQKQGNKRNQVLKNVKSVTNETDISDDISNFSTSKQNKRTFRSDSNVKVKNQFEDYNQQEDTREKSPMSQSFFQSGTQKRLLRVYIPQGYPPYSSFYNVSTANVSLYSEMQSN